MAKYIKIATSGEVTELDLAGYVKLEDFYREIRCDYVQAVPMNDVVMWLDEEGKLTGKLMNQIASEMFWEHFPNGNDFIVGDVVLTAEEDEDGNLLGFSDEKIAQFSSLVGG